MPGYRIRPATADDVGFLTDVVIEATRAQGRLPDGFDERQWREGFTHWTMEQVQNQGPDRATSVVEVDNERAGRLRTTRTAGCIELCGIQLLPGFQRHGIGTAIIEDLKVQAAAAGVLLAGDMLSDIEIPLLDLLAADPLGDYRAGQASRSTTPAARRTGCATATWSRCGAVARPDERPHNRTAVLSG